MFLVHSAGNSSFNFMGIFVAGCSELISFLNIVTVLDAKL